MKSSDKNAVNISHVLGAGGGGGEVAASELGENEAHSHRPPQSLLSVNMGPYLVPITKSSSRGSHLGTVNLSILPRTTTTDNVS